MFIVLLVVNSLWNWAYRNTAVKILVMSKQYDLNQDRYLLPEATSLVDFLLCCCYEKIA